MAGPTNTKCWRTTWRIALQPSRQPQRCWTTASTAKLKQNLRAHLLQTCCLRCRHDCLAERQCGASQQMRCRQHINSWPPTANQILLALWQHHLGHATSRASLKWCKTRFVAMQQKKLRRVPSTCTVTTQTFRKKSLLASPSLAHLVCRCQRNTAASTKAAKANTWPTALRQKNCLAHRWALAVRSSLAPKFLLAL